MLTRPDKWFLFYLFAAYLAIAEVLSLSMSKFPLCIVVSQYQNRSDSSGYQTCAPFHEGVVRFLSFIWNSATHDNIIAFGTMMIALFTWTLWRSTQRLWYVTNDTARRELRAYLSVESGQTFRQSQRHHTRFEFRPNVVNNGRTPASKVRILSKIELRSGALPLGFDFSLSAAGVPPGSMATIGPGKDRFHTVIFPRTLTWSELRHHAKGNIWFHLWGQVTYEDIFRIERHTYFSSMILIPTSKRIATLWLATDRHNHYD